MHQSVETPAPRRFGFTKTGHYINTRVLLENSTKYTTRKIHAKPHPGLEWRIIETFSGPPRKFSAIIGDLQRFSENFGNVRLPLGTILENPRKSSESGGKTSENRRKRRHQYVYIIKRTLHVSQKI